MWTHPTPARPWAQAVLWISDHTATSVSVACSTNSTVRRASMCPGHILQQNQPVLVTRTIPKVSLQKGGLSPVLLIMWVKWKFLPYVAENQGKNYHHISCQHRLLDGVRFWRQREWSPGSLYLGQTSFSFPVGFMLWDTQCCHEKYWCTRQPNTQAAHVGMALACNQM